MTDKKLLVFHKIKTSEQAYMISKKSLGIVKK